MKFALGYRYLAMIVAIIGRKGGIGKTTMAVNLAAALAALGKRVLLVDLDAQASASRSLGIGRADLAPSIADSLIRTKSVASTLRPTAVPGVDLVTASTDLAGIDVSLATMGHKEGRLRTVLQPVAGSYDFVLLDCPPAQSLLTINALVAAERVLIPVVPQFLAVEGVQSLLAQIDRLRETAGARVQPLGLVLSLVDYRLKLTRELVDALRRQYGSLVFGIEVRVNVRLAEAPAFGKTIFEHDDHSPGAAVFRLLAEEFLLRVEHGPAAAAEAAESRAAAGPSIASVPPASGLVH